MGTPVHYESESSVSTIVKPGRGVVTDSTLQSPSVDLATAAAFLEDLFGPGDLIEFHFLETWTEHGKPVTGKLDRRFLSRSEASDQLRQWADRNGEPTFKNVLVGVCPRPALGRAKVNDVQVVKTVWVDIAGELDPEDLKIRCQMLELPEPSWTVRNGSSVQVYWILSEPLVIDGDFIRKRAQGVLRTLAKEFGGSNENLTACASLPGFNNVHNARSGDPPRPCLGRRSESRVGSVFDLERSFDLACGRILYPDPSTEPPDSTPDSGVAPQIVDEVRAILQRGLGSDPDQAEFEAAERLVYASVDHNRCREIVRGSGRFTDPDDERFESFWRLVCAQRHCRLGSHGRARFQPTDLGNAERLVNIFGDGLRYVGPWRRWLTWNGKQWQEDDTGEVMRCARMTIRSIYRDVKAEIDEHKKMNLAKHAVRSESARALTAMVKLAESDHKVAIRPADLDADAWLLNCRNGTIDLRSGQLHEHCRDDMITKIIPVEYKPNAKHHRWIRFLLEIFAKNRELVRFVQRYLGMALTGDVREQVVVIFNGGGSNGKSVLIDTALGMMGEYATITAPELLTSSCQDRHPTEIADLAGRRLVVSSETDEGRRMRVQFIKQATGDASLKARRMREDFWAFPRQFKLLLVTNNLPRVREESHAVWRRIKVVPFDVTIPDDKQDRTLVAKLRDEWPGILGWAVRGCLDWQRTGLCFPAAVEKASLAYRQQEDLIEQFLEDCCVTGNIHSFAVTRKAIRKAYGAWAKEVDERATLSRNAFYKRLRERPGVTEYRGSDGRGFVGIRLAHPAAFLDLGEQRAEDEFISRVLAARSPSAEQLAQQIAEQTEEADPAAGGQSLPAGADSTTTGGSGPADGPVDDGGGS